MDKKPDPETEAKINQLSLMEQNLQGLGLQRQQFQGQALEVESALSELGGSEEAFKIIGNLMVKVSKDKLREDLASRKETMRLRIQGLEKQEEGLREKTKALQQDILQRMKSTEVKGK